MMVVRKKGKTVTITHAFKSGGNLFLETRQAKVVVETPSDNLLKMDLELKRQINDQTATYFYSVDKNTGDVNKRLESDLTDGCLYEFENMWSSHWDPVLPMADQVDKTRQEVLKYEPDQSFVVQTEPCLRGPEAPPPDAQEDWDTHYESTSSSSSKSTSMKSSLNWKEAVEPRAPTPPKRKTSKSIRSSVKALFGSSTRNSSSSETAGKEENLARSRPSNSHVQELPPFSRLARSEPEPSSLMERVTAAEGHYETPSSESGGARNTSPPTVRNTQLPPPIVGKTPTPSVKKSSKSSGLVPTSTRLESGQEEIYIHRTIEEKSRKKSKHGKRMSSESPYSLDGKTPSASAKKSSRSSSLVPAPPRLESDQEEIHRSTEKSRKKKSKHGSRRSHTESHYEVPAAVGHNSRPPSHHERYTDNEDDAHVGTPLYPIQEHENPTGSRASKSRRSSSKKSYYDVPAAATPVVDITRNSQPPSEHDHYPKSAHSKVDKQATTKMHTTETHYEKQSPAVAAASPMNSANMGRGETLLHRDTSMLLRPIQEQEINGQTGSRFLEKKSLRRTTKN